MQAYIPAAKALAEEIRHSVLAVDMNRIPELSTALDSCLWELQAMRSTLVMYPATEWDDRKILLKPCGQLGVCVLGYFFIGYGLQGIL